MADQLGAEEGETFRASKLRKESEQAILSTATEKTKAEPAGQAALVIPQKNLVHAVNAVLSSLDSLSHRLDTGGRITDV